MSPLLISKAEMLERFKEPYFGYTDIPSGAKYGLPYAAKVYVRSDLPRSVRISVEAHELCHAADKDFGSQFDRERRAWWAGFKAHPIGFFYGIVLSLTPERLGLYWRRWRQNF